MSDYRLKIDYNHIKAGTISEEWRDHSWNPVYVFRSDDIELNFNKESINNLLQKDIVEKLPEPKWTDEDMIDFVNWIDNQYGLHLNITRGKQLLEEYEKSRQTKDI